MEYKMTQQSLILTIFFIFSFSAFSKPYNAHIEINNLSNAIEHVLPKILQKQDGRIQLDDIEIINPCLQYKIKCVLHSIVGDLELKNPYNTFNAEFTEQNIILYKVDLPTAWLNSSLLIEGTIFGRKIGIELDVQLKGVKTAPRNPTRLKNYSGAGEMLVREKNSNFEIKSLRAVNTKLTSIKLNASNPTLQKLYEKINKLINIENFLLKHINSSVADYLSSYNTVTLIESTLKQLTTKLQNLTRPIEKTGFKVKTTNPSLYETTNYYGKFKFKTELKSKLAQHPCARNLETIQGRYIDKTREERYYPNNEHAIALTVPVPFLSDILFKMMKYPLIEKERVIAPLLCNSGKEKYKFGPFKLKFKWNIRPYGKVAYIVKEQSKLFTVNLNVLADAKSLKKLTSINLYRKEVDTKRKRPGIIAKIELQYKADLNDKNGLHLKLQDFKIKQIIGKVHIGLLGTKIGPRYSLNKLKEEIEEMVYLEFGNEIKLIKILGKEETVPDQNISVTLRNIALEKGLFSVGLRFE